MAHGLWICAGAAGAACVHRREAHGRPEVDHVLETHDGGWIGVEVELGEREVDRAPTSLRRPAERVPRDPKAPVVITGTSLAYTRDDGVHVVPLGVLGP